MIFRGTFEHALDAKNRLTVPAKYRADLAGGVVLALAPTTEADGVASLALWKAVDYESFTAAALAGLNPIGPRAQALRTMFYANAWDSELDGAHRVMIPLLAKEFAGLGKEVMITGAGECLRIWDRSTFATYSASVFARFPDIAASFDHTS